MELPIHGLPAHLLNLRRTLVSSLGKPPADEDDIIASTKAAIVTGLFGPFQSLQMRRDCCIQIDNSLCLSQTVLSSVSRWIRNIVASSFLSSDPDIQCTSPCNYGKEYSTPIVISLAQFQSIRSVLEKFEDFPILADVVKIFSGSNDIAILAAATDTINLHFDVFDAIGAITDLFGTLYLQHEKICCQKSLERPFIESLVDLGQHISRSGREVSKLRAELLIYMRNSSTTACSLVSENMVETLQIAEPIFLDEIEQVLSSGTIMENHTMDRIFDLLTRRQRISWTTNGIEQSPIILAELLTRLRTFDSIYFERLVENWLDKLLLSTDRPTLSEILPPFICSSALTLASILERTNRLSENAESSRHFVSLALEAFELMTLNLDLPPYLLTVSCLDLA